MNPSENNPTVLLVYPGKREMTGYSYNYDFPVGLLYIASALKKIGIHVSMFDMRKDKISDFNFSNYLFVGITMLTGNMITNGLKTAKMIKDYDRRIPVVVGGVHATVLPEQTLENDLVDFVVIGEGEKTVQELAGCLIDKSDLSKVRGLGYKEDKKIIINPARDFLDMNGLDYDLPYESLGFDLSVVGRVPVHTSRGCPYRCSFCYNPFVHKRKYRSKNSSRVIEEIEYLLSKFSNLSFIDFTFEDEFFINPKRIYPILEYLVSKDLKIEWSAFCRFDTLDKIDDEHLELIHKSGCYMLSFGGESGSQRMLDEIIQKDMKVDQIARGVERLKKANIPHLVSFMSCLPTETKDDLNATFSLVEKITHENPIFWNNGMFLFYPIPGTALFERVIKDFNFTPPKTLAEWGNYEAPLTSASWVTWQNKEYIKMCEELYLWSTYRPYRYFQHSTYNDYHPVLLPNNKEVYLSDNIINFIGKTQKLRYKYKFFKYPIEFKSVVIYSKYKEFRFRSFLKKVFHTSLERVLGIRAYNMLKSWYRSKKGLEND